MRATKLRPTSREVTPFSATDLTLAETGEPTVHDLLLAERLGFVLPREIRRLIERNREELEAFGILWHRATKSEGRGRPGREFYLNRQQALLVTILSKTSIAAQVRRQMIEVFDVALRGAPPRQAAAPCVVALTPDQVRDRLAGLERAILAVMQMIPETPAIPAPAAAPPVSARATKRRTKPGASKLPVVTVPVGLPSDVLYGLQAIGTYLGMTERQAKHRALSGHIPVLKIGRSVCARRSELAAWLDRLTAEREERAGARVSA